LDAKNHDLPSVINAITSLITERKSSNNYTSSKYNNIVVINAEKLILRNNNQNNSASNYREASHFIRKALKSKLADPYLLKYVDIKSGEVQLDFEYKKYDVSSYAANKARRNRVFARYKSDLLEKEPDLSHNDSVDLQKRKALADFLQDNFSLNADEADARAGKICAEISGEFNSSSAPKAPHNPLGLTLPEKAPELYSKREKDPVLGRKHTAIEFYDTHWRKYADAGVLFQDDLRKLDPSYMDGISNFCKSHNRKHPDSQLRATDFLPPPKSKKTEQILQSGSTDVRALARAQIAIGRRNERSLK
jgi:hypothetical protein